MGPKSGMLNVMGKELYKMSHQNNNAHRFNRMNVAVVGGAITVVTADALDLLQMVSFAL